jgi:membrane-associated phospholipid phosphatase
MTSPVEAFTIAPHAARPSREGMTAIAAAGRRYLPCGWIDLGRQLLIWFGFLAAYQLARGIADRDPAAAFTNGLKVIDIERQANAFYELTIQQLVNQSHTLMLVTSFTYWNSEFTVVGLTLLWVYLRRNEAFSMFRNWLLTANVLGLVGYILLPTAPPRMFPDFGFVDTLAGLGSFNHGSGVIELASNPYAAMPSLHAADALIVGITLAFVVRSRWAKAIWVIWPAWVWFCVMATGNHFLLDILAGLVVAGLAALPFYGRTLARRFRGSPASAS